MSKFKVGDKVKVVRKSTLEEDILHPLWLDKMDKTIGKISRIVSILENGDIKLENGYGYWYPSYVLEKVEDAPQPICPINLYFEGDEEKCNTSKCDWDTETRSCSQDCNISSKLVKADEIPEGNPEIKDWALPERKLEEFGHIGVDSVITHTDEELFESKDAMLPGKGISFHKFEKPDCRILKTFDNLQQKVDYTIEISTHELTALCPLTSFPDFYDLKISYKPRFKCIESKSAKFYFHSFRDYGGFIETLANMIADDWVKACAPKWLKVELTMAPRGGIPITVVVERVSSDRIE